MKPTTVSVVMPVYNECYTIREILRRVCARPEVTEVVIVDDGSTDGTRERLQELERRHSAKDRPLKIIYKDANEGKGAALVAGFRAATGEFTIVQDADLEYDPEDYPTLLAPLQAGSADVVYGSRFLAGGHSVLLFWHTVANKLLTLACNLLADLNLTDVWTGYKVFRTEIIQKIPLTSRGFDFEPEVTIKLAKLGCRIYEVPVRYIGRSRAEGKKIGLKDAFIGTWRMVQTFLAADLGELAIGEQTLRIMSKAGRYNAFMASRYRPLLGARVVEVGSGVGNIARFLLDREKLTLTDPDPGYVRQLAAAYKDWDYVDVRPLDIVHPGRGAEPLWGEFDSAVCFNVLEHIEDDAAALKNMRRLLAPGGNLILIVPAHPALHGTLDRNLGHFRRYGRDGLRELILAAGFEEPEMRLFNPIAVPGWWLNGKIFRRKVIPNFQVALFDRLTFSVRWSDRLNLPFGLSLMAWARKA